MLTQRIVLKGDPATLGENAIVVKINEARGPWDIDGPIGLPTRAMIASELDQTFAGIDMQLANTFERNSFGPFGYAIGHPTPQVDLRLRLGIRRLEMVEARRGAGRRAVDAGAPDFGAGAALPLDARRGRDRGDAAPDFRCIRRIRASPISTPTTPAASAPAMRWRRRASAISSCPPPRRRRPRASRRRRSRDARSHHKRRRPQRGVEVEEERAAAEDAPDRNTVNVPMPGGARAAGAPRRRRRTTRCSRRSPRRRRRARRPTTCRCRRAPPPPRAPPAPRAEIGLRPAAELSRLGLIEPT